MGEVIEAKAFLDVPSPQPKAEEKTAHRGGIDTLEKLKEVLSLSRRQKQENSVPVPHESVVGRVVPPSQANSERCLNL